MNDDFRDLNLDKPMKREAKTPEQMSKHTVECYLENRAVDRAIHLLTVGEDFQRISVMKNLPSLIKEDLTACIQRVVPRIHQTLSHGTTEYNIAACEAIRTVASQDIMSTDNFTKVFLQHILSSLDSRDTVAADEWLNTLLDIIPVLPISVLQNEVLVIAVNKAHISKPVSFRINSCKIVGRLALSFTPYLVKKELVPLVFSLCQDVSAEVRAAMARELPNISATLGQETSSSLMTYILDLNLDEDLMVREAIFGAIAQMLPRFPIDVLKTAIIPYIKRVFPEMMKNENSLLLALSKFYGQYAIGLKNVLVVAEKEQFLQRYIQLSQINAKSRKKLNPYKPIDIDEDEVALRLTECRLNCAYNYPAMVVFAADLKQQTADSLFPVLSSLASDSFYEVRKKIAAGFFEVMKLAPRWLSSLKNEFIKLLRDDIDVVLEGLVPNIGHILVTFSNSGFFTTDKPDSGKDIGQALFICEKNLSETPKWRLYEQLLLELRVIPKVFHPEFVNLTFVPLLLSRAMNGRILPCRVAALHTLLVIVADTSQAKTKLKIRNKILELCQNSSFHCRLLFLKGMTILISLSPETVKELFFYNITSMAEDKVANIRLVLCKMLAKLKFLALEPLDRKLLASVDAAVSVLKTDTDRDVTAQLKIAINQMDDFDKSKDMKLDQDINFQGPSKGVLHSRYQQANAFSEMRSNNTSMNLRSPSSSSVVNSQEKSGRQNIPARQGGLASRSATLGSISSGEPGVRPVPRAESAVRPVPRGEPAAKPVPRSQIHQRPVGGRHEQLTDSGRKRSLEKLSPDDFLVDAGVSLKTTTEVKRIPTPRPVHRTLITLVPSKENVARDKSESAERSLVNLSSTRSSLGVINKNLNVPNYSSNLPVKKTSLKPLSNDEIEKELMQSDNTSSFTRRISNRLKSSGTAVKTVKKENKRLSLDVAEIANISIGPEIRSSNINKRYSLDVDSKKVLGNKKSLTCINNNTLLSPKLGSTRSGIVRPQSCVLQTEKVNHSKRSMSVENLPPKVTRLASRLPIRSTDPKPSKPK